MRIRIHFDDGKESEFQARYLTIYPKTDNRAGSEPEIHIETLDGDNHYFGLSIISTVVGVNR